MAGKRPDRNFQQAVAWIRKSPLAKALDEIEARAEEEVVKAVEFAEATPEPAMEELYTDIYAD